MMSECEAGVWERGSWCGEVLGVEQTRSLLGFSPWLWKDLAYVNNLSAVKYSVSQVWDSILSW